MTDWLLSMSVNPFLSAPFSLPRLEWFYLNKGYYNEVYCTHLHNHAIYFNQPLHKLGKQSGLSNYIGKIDELWPTSRSLDPIWPLNPLSKCQNWHVIDHISKNPYDILLIYFLFFGHSLVLNYRPLKNYINTFIWLQDPVKKLSVRLPSKVQGGGN